MFEPNSEPVTTQWDDNGDPNQDTIALLQEEIARLEAELRARDDVVSPPPAPGPDPEPVENAAGPLQSRIDGLLADLAERDELAEILMEQARLLEEDAAAQRAEWEQLHQWVDQVERRVEGRDSEGLRLRAELENEHAQLEAIRRSAESDRREWDAHRAGLEREVQLLRDQLARRPEGPGARDKAAFLELAAENRRLRTDAETSRKEAADAEELGLRLNAALGDLEQARRALRQLDDERQREGVEHEAALGAIRSELARESLRRQAETVAAPKVVDTVTARSSATEADERIRAFRLHLKELHETEAARRADRSIASRLSRLWNHTGPN